MKPFNLEQAKAGKSVCTRDGAAVRIICFDRKTYKNTNYEYQCMIALVTTTRDKEIIQEYYPTGKKYNDGQESNFDLFMQEVTNTGWINIFYHMIIIQ